MDDRRDSDILTSRNVFQLTSQDCRRGTIQARSWLQEAIHIASYEIYQAHQQTIRSTWSVDTIYHTIIIHINESIPQTSSRKSTFGRATSSMPMLTLLRCPPEIPLSRSSPVRQAQMYHTRYKRHRLAPELINTDNDAPITECCT